MFSKRISLTIILLLALVIIILLAVYPPVPQSLAYLNFADNRELFGIPNFWNVVSNLGFLFVGIVGLCFLCSKNAQVDKRFAHKKERYAYLTFFFGSFLIAFGSAYFHWHPTVQTLVWDRLAMTVSFMGFFAAMISERINYKLGFYLLVPLVIFGMASVVYWHYTNDLRPYVFVQFFPLIALPLLIILLPSKYTGVWYLVAALAMYVIAKIFEMYDKSIYLCLHGGISGHTLKHFTAAVAIFFVFLYLYFRRIKD